MDLEWKILAGFTTAGILNEIQNTMGDLQCDPADIKGRIIFMSMFDDIVWDAKGNEELCENNSERVEEYARRFPRGHWSFLGPGKMSKDLAHPIFLCTSALETGELRSKGGGKATISDENVRLLLKMVMSVNQLSLYGAVADLIIDLPDDQRAPGKPLALDQMETRNSYSTSSCRSTSQ